MDNFKCSQCGHEWHEVHFKITYRNEGKVLLNKVNAIIDCPKCKSTTVEFTKDNTNFSNIQLAKYSMASPTDKKAMLKKRAAEYSKKTEGDRLARKAKILNKFTENN